MLSTLFDRGYYVIRRGLQPEQVSAHRAPLVKRVAAYLEEKKYPEYIYTDGVANTLAVSIDADRFFIDAGRMLLHSMGLQHVHYLAGAVIPKYLNEGRRQWHVDWWNWDDPVTREILPPQVGLIFYLDDATPETGCLLALPGSNRGQFKSQIHELVNTKTPNDREITVDAKAGDIVVFDARMLHAVTANSKVDLRMAITMWYLVESQRLSEESKATAMCNFDTNMKQKLGDLAPMFTPTVPPKPCLAQPKWQ